MPNCFQLTRKSDPQAGPVPLNTIDKEMCEHFECPVNPVWYCLDWYNTIGFGLAMGETFATMKEKYNRLEQDENEVEEKEYYANLRKAVEWLDQNFTADAWVEVGRN